LDQDSDAQDMTPDGRFVLFFSTADNVVRGLSNSSGLFIRDLFGGTTRSVGPGGAGGDMDFTCCAAISANGRYVGFTSDTVLTPGDTNRVDDVFVRDLSSKVTKRVSVGQGGKQADAFSSFDAISGDGCFSPSPRLRVILFQMIAMGRTMCSSATARMAL